MHTWQALVLLRGEYGNARLDAPHIQNADLDRFVLDKTEGVECIEISEHTRQCRLCQFRLKEARVFARLLSQIECPPPRNYSIPDRRREQRYAVTEPATITVCHPVENVEIRGVMVDVSKSGCRLRTPNPVYCGADVLILVKKAAVFGTVRRCCAIAQGFEIGLRIEQVVMGLDSNAALQALKNQLEADDQREQRSATLPALSMHADRRWPMRED